MKLVSMKLPKTKKTPTPELAATAREKYPWGLQINLKTEQVKKLGLDLKKLKVGQPVKISAKATIKALRQESAVDGKEFKHVCLQITDLAVDTKTGNSFDEAWDESD